MSDIGFGIDDGIATITFNRPEKLNSLTLAMYDDLAAAFDRVRDDDTIGVAILTGSGDRAFCVGADLTESIPALARGDFDISRWDGAHQKHTTLYKPVIAAVNGLCLGGGFEIMLSTDLRIAAESARFSLPESGVGVVPAGGTLTRLARQIPYAWAMELMLLGERISATRAHGLGLLNEVVPDHQLRDRATQIARTLLTKSGTALQVIKESVQTLYDLPVAEAFPLEAQLGQRAFTDPDAAEGLDAFATRRTPHFPSREHDDR